MRATPAAKYLASSAHRRATSAVLERALSRRHSGRRQSAAPGQARGRGGALAIGRLAVNAEGGLPTLGLGALARRTIVCQFDARMEHPERRPFSFDPIDRVLDDRGAYVAAALTVARAYLAYLEDGNPEVCPPLGSYDAGPSSCAQATLAAHSDRDGEKLLRLRDKAAKDFDRLRIDVVGATIRAPLHEMPVEVAEISPPPPALAKGVAAPALPMAVSAPALAQQWVSGSRRPG
jgi:hypothetical protein